MKEFKVVIYTSLDSLDDAKDSVASYESYFDFEKAEIYELDKLYVGETWGLMATIPGTQTKDV